MLPAFADWRQISILFISQSLPDFGLTRSEFEHTISHTRREHPNHYTTDAVNFSCDTDHGTMLCMSEWTPLNEPASFTFHRADDIWQYMMHDWLIDWLIVCCLMSSGKWLLHIQDDNKFNNIITKIYRKWGRNVITATTTIDWHRKHTVSVGIISPVSGFPQHDNPRLIEMTPSMCHLGTQLKLYF